MGNVRVYKIKDGKFPIWNKNLIIDINADPKNRKLLYHIWQAVIRELDREPEGTQAGYPSI